MSTLLRGLLAGEVQNEEESLHETGDALHNSSTSADSGKQVDKSKNGVNKSDSTVQSTNPVNSTESAPNDERSSQENTNDETEKAPVSYFSLVSIFCS